MNCAIEGIVTSMCLAGELVTPYWEDDGDLRGELLGQLLPFFRSDGENDPKSAVGASEVIWFA